MRRPLLIIACGALAREVRDILTMNNLGDVDFTCIPAEYHNTPAKIAPAVEAKILAAHAHYQKVLVAFGDCGTGGALDGVLERHGVERLDGAHCYAFFAGHKRFDALHDAEPGTFYLTDFLARHFDTMVYKGLGLDRHPELRDLYFGNYTRTVYLAQTSDPALQRDAEAAAARLGLPLTMLQTGYGELATFIQHHAVREAVHV